MAKYVRPTATTRRGRKGLRADSPTQHKSGEEEPAARDAMAQQYTSPATG
jgi:hypothetical protein